MNVHACFVTVEEEELVCQFINFQSSRQKK